MLRLLLRSLLLIFLVGGFVAFDDGRAEADTGLASWYGAPQLTASGEVFDPHGYTAAHRTLPFGTRLTVGYEGRTVQVTVNDRGPYVGGRVLDLSQGAAESLGLTKVGVDRVDYRVVGGGGYRAGGYFEQNVDDYRVRDHSDGLRGERYAPDRTSDRVDSGGGGYVVRSGDTLTGIADELGTTVGDLASTNGIDNPDVISVGQTLSY